MYLPTWQNVNLQNLESQLVSERKPSKRLFLSLAASCTYRSYMRLSLSSPDGKDTALADEQSLSPPRSFVRTSTEISGFIRFNTNIIPIITYMSRKKHFFLFFFNGRICNFSCYDFQIFLIFFQAVTLKFHRSTLPYSIFKIQDLISRMIW